MPFLFNNNPAQKLMLKKQIDPIPFKKVFQIKPVNNKRRLLLIIKCFSFFDTCLDLSELSRFRYFSDSNCIKKY